MRRLTTFAALPVALAAVSGCASPGLPTTWDERPQLAWEDIRGLSGAVVLAEQPAPAPAGLVAYCKRIADACDAGPNGSSDHELGDSDGASYHHTAWSADGAQAESGIRLDSANEDGAAIFARMIAARAHGGSFHFARREIALTEDLWRELETVNLGVNRNITAKSDAYRYGATEYWAMPMTERRASDGPVQGDCEDYALEKRALLISLGWDSEALALAVAYAPDIGMHAVLVAQTDHGDFVLDNLHDDLRTPESLDYRWVSRQAGAAMTVWASARMELAPTLGERRRDLFQASLNPAALDRGGGGRLALLSTVVEPSS